MITLVAMTILSGAPLPQSTVQHLVETPPSTQLHFRADRPDRYSNQPPVLTLTCQSGRMLISISDVSGSSVSSAPLELTAGHYSQSAYGSQFMGHSISAETHAGQRLLSAIRLNSRVRAQTQGRTWTFDNRDSRDRTAFVQQCASGRDSAIGTSPVSQPASLI